MTVIEGADYFIRLIELPGSVGGFITPNEDGTISMYLNTNHDKEAQLDTYTHEYEHIINDDLYGDKDIRDIENRR